MGKCLYKERVYLIESWIVYLFNISSPALPKTTTTTQAKAKPTYLEQKPSPKTEQA
jgi:hypothetical protein